MFDVWIELHESVALDVREHIKNQTSNFKNSSRRAHVDWRWGASRDRALLFDRIHRDANFREEQHAMVRAAAGARGDQGVPAACTTRADQRRLRPRQLPHQ